MGTQATGMTGSSTSTRQGWAVLGALAVAAFAGVLHLTGADGAEVVATLLFAVVFGAALLGGRIAGFVVAAAATALYAWLRRDAADEAGAAPLAVVVFGRAASYAVLAFVSDRIGDRLPQLAFGGRSSSPEDSELPQEQFELAAAPVELDGPGAWDTEAAAGWGSEMAPPEAVWQPPVPGDPVVAGNGYHDAATGPYQPVDPYRQGGPYQPVDPYEPVDPYQPADPYEPVDPYRQGGPYQPVDPYRQGDPYQSDPYQPIGADGSRRGGIEAGDPDWPQEGDQWENRWEDQGWPPTSDDGAQSVPAGWLQDDAYGDEIPVGYTGELFLQNLAGHQGQREQDERDAGQLNGEDVPMIDGMPFGQPLTPRGYDDQHHDGRIAGDERGVSPEPGPYPTTRHDQAWSTDHEVGRDGWGRQGEGQPHYGGQEAGSPDSGGEHVDSETRLWTASYFRDRLAAEYEEARTTGAGFSVVMIQIPDTPFRTLSHRRQVALLRELGHQFIRAQIVDHLVHLPDGDNHWFAAVLSDIDRAGAHGFERRLRSAIAGYLRNRGLGLEDIQSATLTSPDDDEMMSQIWASLLGEDAQGQVHSQRW